MTYFLRLRNRIRLVENVQYSTVIQSLCGSERCPAAWSRREDALSWVMCNDLKGKPTSEPKYQCVQQNRHIGVPKICFRTDRLTDRVGLGVGLGVGSPSYKVEISKVIFSFSCDVRVRTHSWPYRANIRRRTRVKK